MGRQVGSFIWTVRGWGLTLPSCKEKSFCDTGFPSGSVVKSLPAVQELHETQVQSLGREDALEKDVATYSSVLAWRSPWTEEPGGLWSMGLQRVGHD